MLQCPGSAQQCPQGFPIDLQDREEQEGRG